MTMNFRLIRFFLPGLLLLLNGCAKPPEPDASGQELFDYYCDRCHGETGKGKTFFGFPSLVDEELARNMILRILDKGSEERGNQSKHREEMPAFKQLSDKQIDRLVDYLYRLRKQQMEL